MITTTWKVYAPVRFVVRPGTGSGPSSKAQFNFLFLLHKPGPDLQARYYINGLPGLEKFEPVPPLVVVIQKRFDCN